MAGVRSLIHHPGPFGEVYAKAAGSPEPGDGIAQYRIDGAGVAGCAGCIACAAGEAEKRVDVAGEVLLRPDQRQREPITQQNRHGEARR